MLLKTRSRSKREQTKFPRFLNNIRACQCIIPGCGKEAEAAHLRLSSAAHGKFNARDDKWVNPLCPEHHRLGPQAQHSMGESQFWELYAVDPLETALKLWQSRDSLEAMQAIAQAPIIQGKPKPR